MINTMPNFNTVVFDVDSTIVTIEGLAEIARKKGLYDEVVAITNGGMNGEVSFSHSLQTRLDLVAPHRDDILWLGELYIQHLTAGAEETIQALHEQDVAVYLISGAYTLALQKLATHLHIPLERVVGVSIAFDEDGQYQEIHPGQKIIEDHGKRKVLEMLNPKRHIAFVGDGITDLETTEYVDRFIGFGGVSVRDSIKQAADYYIDSPDLRDVLQWL